MKTTKYSAKELIEAGFHLGGIYWRIQAILIGISCFIIGCLIGVLIK